MRGVPDGCVEGGGLRKKKKKTQLINWFCLALYSNLKFIYSEKAKKLMKCITAPRTSVTFSWNSKQLKLKKPSLDGIAGHLTKNRCSVQNSFSYWILFNNKQSESSSHSFFYIIILKLQFRKYLATFCCIILFFKSQHCIVKVAGFKSIWHILNTKCFMGDIEASPMG